MTYSSSLLLGTLVVSFVRPAPIAPGQIPPSRLTKSSTTQATSIVSKTPVITLTAASTVTGPAVVPANAMTLWVGGAAPEVTVTPAPNLASITWAYSAESLNPDHTNIHVHGTSVADASDTLYYEADITYPKTDEQIVIAKRVYHADQNGEWLSNEASTGLACTGVQGQSFVCTYGEYETAHQTANQYTSTVVPAQSEVITLNATATSTWQK